MAEDIRMKVAQLLLRDLRDPRLTGLTITRVELTGDMSRATLYFRVFPGAATREDVETAAKSAAAFLRHEIGKSLRLRSTPELVFRHDDLPDEGARIDELLARVRTEHPDADSGTGEGPAADDDE